MQLFPHREFQNYYRVYYHLFHAAQPKSALGLERIGLQQRTPGTLTKL